MAVLTTDDGKVLNKVEDINKYLTDLKIELSSWPLPENPELKLLLKKEQLSDAEKQQVLQALNTKFEEQQKKFGYKTQDLVCLTPQTEGLDELLAKFDRIHTHNDDEVRYIVEGSGIFGFVLKNKRQCLLKVEAEEYIRVPANTEHWFLLDETKNIKAVRYFISPAGWVAIYTDKEVNIAP